MTAQAESPEYSVEITDVVKHFPLRGKSGRVVHAVDGITVSSPRASTLALVGESGCGKSTVARMLVGLTTPTSGTVRVAGSAVVPITTSDRAARRRAQLVSQSPWSALNRRKSVRHILSQPLRVHHLASGPEIDRRLRELLDMVGLTEDYLTRRPRDLSGGELQRVTIARALAAEPAVLVLDEPTASLDVSVKAILVNLLRDLQERLGVSYVLITHELDIARHLADRVAVMYLGEIVEFGDARDVFDDPQHPYTRSLLAAAPSAESVGQPPRVGLTGEVPSAVAPPSGCRFHTRCPFAQDRCAEQVPELTRRPDGRSVACLRIDELPPGLPRSD